MVLPRIGRGKGREIENGAEGGEEVGGGSGCGEEQREGGRESGWMDGRGQVRSENASLESTRAGGMTDRPTDRPIQCDNKDRWKVEGIRCYSRNAFHVRITAELKMHRQYNTDIDPHLPPTNSIVLPSLGVQFASLAKVHQKDPGARFLYISSLRSPHQGRAPRREVQQVGHDEVCSIA